MSLQVDVWSDFACPWCYLVFTSLEKLKETHQITVSWHSYELRPKSGRPYPKEYIAKVLANRPRMKAIAQTHYDVDFNEGPFGIDSRPALIGMKYAETQNKGAAYHRAVFHQYWQEAKNIEDPETLANIAEGVDLEREAFSQALGDETLDSQVSDDIQRAYHYDIRGVPALIVENKFMIPGAQPYDELVRIIEQIEGRLAQEG